MNKPHITMYELLTAITFGDLGLLANRLKKITVTRDMFLQFCRTAIDIGNIATLEWLLDAYYQHWTQPVFDGIISYIKIKKQYHIYGFIDRYIDRVNDKFLEMHKLQTEQDNNIKNGNKKITRTGFLEKIKGLWRNK